MLKSMHLFAGAGGGLLGDLILGHNPVVAVEWEPYACQVLRERAEEGWFPDLQVWEGDVRLFDPSDYAGIVDCIHAGFPCQDLSSAGKQAGLGEGTRSGLYREVLRIADVVRPQYLFLENVSAIVSMGRDGIGQVLSDISAMGYDARWITLRASDVGAPHHRDRWWCLCTRRTDVQSHAEHGRVGRREQQQEGIESETGNFRHPASTRLPQRTGEQMGQPGQVEEPERSDCEVSGTARTDLQRDVAKPNGSRHTDGQAQVEPAEGRIDAQRQSCAGCADVADTRKAGLQGRENAGSNGCDRAECGHEQPAGCDGVSRRSGAAESCMGVMADGLADRLDAYQELQGWWEVEPQIGRVTTENNRRADQLKALGNGQVPMQAAVAWTLLGGC